MKITVNNTALDFATEGKTLAFIIASLDEIIENAGQLIVAIHLNGLVIDTKAIAAMEKRMPEESDSLELFTDSICMMKIQAIETLLELVSATKADEEPVIRESVLQTWSQYKSVFGSLFSAEELSFIEAFEVFLANASPMTKAAREETTHRIEVLFTERLHEIKDPKGAMRSAENLFNALKADLSEVPVRIQTGKDAEAMRTMVLVVELINKTVRILPDFTRQFGDSVSMMIGNKNIQEFYDDFNSVLRELMGAFEHKDSVLIGDLAEYEILPRMNLFFESTGKMMVAL